MVIVAAIAAVAVLALFLIVMLLNGRPNEEIDSRHQNGSAVVELPGGSPTAQAGRVIRDSGTPV